MCLQPLVVGKNEIKILEVYRAEKLQSKGAVSSQDVSCCLKKSFSVDVRCFHIQNSFFQNCPAQAGLIVCVEGLQRSDMMNKNVYSQINLSLDE